jgi:hypothetical protein
MRFVLSAMFWGDGMPDRSWFFAANGQQQGPYPEAQFRDFVSRGMIRSETLVWTEGMTGWLKAGDVPGLMSQAAGPPMMPRSGPPPAVAGDGGYGSPLSADLPIWGLLGRSLLYVIGVFLIIPAPWVATAFYRWFVSRIQVPGRGNLYFTGQVGDIWWVFVLMGLANYIGVYDNRYQLIANVLEAVLSWLVLRWVIGNLAASGQKLPTSFDGNVWAFIGWNILLVISFITIIGWAWVSTAWTRWICRNISGTRREIVFNATGLEVLWRTLVMVIACAFVIPIPWMIRWYAQWYVSQFALAPPGSYANA